ncbi:extradiol dioxygenase [Catellatospora sp. TT07R-123]|uniref:VOC family protein n=1 Tax=Catellatospora sp. TT07R-123 TaxID=2733863 RepID=UPI001AFDCF9B|nr:VOC family protein [Catellatospora sp. TT07R-123]GHJ48300.1 extradiol dioxygenase [Catellatospora sp. TT07R-123]
MDALHPRLLVTDFPRSFAFYEAVLPRLAGANLARGGAGGPYASWDVDGQGLLSLFDRRGMAAIAGDIGGGGAAMLVCRVDDVDEGARLCAEHGAVLVAAPTDRPQWGPGLRTAHLRDPDGVLIELQSY